MKKLNLLIICFLLSFSVKSQYNWQFWPVSDAYYFEHDNGSNGIFIEDFKLIPSNKLILNVDTVQLLSWNIKLSDITNWNSKLSSYTPTLSINNNTLTAGGNSITIPSQITQTLTGSNGITVTSAANTFTISKTKRQETYSGTTNSSGVYSVTFSQAYSVAPNIQANIVSGSSNQVITIIVTTTGFTCTVVQRNSVTLLATEVLLASTVNVNNALVDVLITEK